jgi:Ser/Thr protein kinase RdoA (MazF antagonist)
MSQSLQPAQAWAPVFAPSALREELSESAIRRVAQAFTGHTRVTASQWIGGGPSKCVYRLAAAPGDRTLSIISPWIIRRYLRTSDDHDFELRFTDALRNHGVPVPRHYPTREGADALLTELVGQRVWVTLHDFVRGKTISRLRPRQREAAIVALAKSHCAARAIPIAGTRIGGFRMLRRMEEEGDEYPVLVTPDPVVTDAMHRLREHARTARHTILTRSGGCEVLPIHGDFYQANLIYRGETLTAVIDFDECRRDHLFVDLGIAMECLQQDDATAEFVALFRRIYEDVAPLPGRDFAFALVLIAFRQASGALSRSFPAARAATLGRLERVERLLALAADMLG